MPTQKETFAIRGKIMRVGKNGENTKSLFDHEFNVWVEFYLIKFSNGGNIFVKESPESKWEKYSNTIISAEKFENRRFFIRTSSFYIIKELS